MSLWLFAPAIFPGLGYLRTLFLNSSLTPTYSSYLSLNLTSSEKASLILRPGVGPLLSVSTAPCTSLRHSSQ